MKTAVEISRWFIGRKLDFPENTLEGNTRLQKLLFFAWLIHYKKFQESLFDDDFYAFSNGPVVENSRIVYKDNYFSLVFESSYSNCGESSSFDSEFTPNELESLNLTENLFGDASLDELINLSHNSPVWSKYNEQYMRHEALCKTGKPNRLLSKMPKDEFSEEFRMIGNVLSSYEDSLLNQNSKNEGN